MQEILKNSRPSEESFTAIATVDTVVFSNSFVETNLKMLF